MARGDPGDVVGVVLAGLENAKLRPSAEPRAAAALSPARRQAHDNLEALAIALAGLIAALAEGLVAKVT